MALVGKHLLVNIGITLDEQAAPISCNLDPVTLRWPFKMGHFSEHRSLKMMKCISTLSLCTNSDYAQRLYKLRYDYQFIIDDRKVTSRIKTAKILEMEVTLRIEIIALLNHDNSFERCA